MKKINLDLKAGKTAVSSALQKTSEISKKASSGIQVTAKNLSDKSRQNRYERKLKKYNPVFPEMYFSESFNIPNMIMIVDDAVRRDVDVCEGAIGWLGQKSEMEILYLYDEFVNESKIKFVPAPICDAIYYVDRFDRNKFIQTDCIFDKAHEERIAELENIACSLGAKKCTIEISESVKEATASKFKASKKNGAKFESLTVSDKTNIERTADHKNSTERKGITVTEFAGSENAKAPELKWFKYEDSIKNLIEMRCSGDNQVKTRTLQLDGASSATMSKKTACSIDKAINDLGAGIKSDMESKATKEYHSKLIYSVEF